MLDVNQSMLTPAGVPASPLEHLRRLMLWTSMAVFVVVLAFVLAAVVRRRNVARCHPPNPLPDEDVQALR